MDLITLYLEIINHNGKLFKFGDQNHYLKANLKIKNPNFTFNWCNSLLVSFLEAEVHPL
mgnify:CR=1 FL=1